jgi:hypothetical protein
VVKLSEVVMAAAITVSVAGVSYVAYNPQALTARAETVAEQAGCRAVDQAIVAYTATHDAAPRTITDLKPYVRGDISAYRITGGVAAGPGCPVGPPASR